MSGKNALMSVINQNARQQGQAGAFDALASIISGAAAEPVAGYAGIMAAPSGRGGDVVRGTQDALTYQPRTEQGQRMLGQFGAAMAPVGEAFQQGAQYLGDTAYDATGSPVMAAAAYSAPTAIAEILGLKGAGKAARASGANQYEMGDISSYTQGPQGKQRGIFAGVKAKGADMENLNKAQELELAGTDRGAIWQETGWFKGPDNKWRWEIDDSERLYSPQQRVHPDDLARAEGAVASAKADVEAYVKENQQNFRASEGLERDILKADLKRKQSALTMARDELAGIEGASRKTVGDAFDAEVMYEYPDLQDTAFKHIEQPLQYRGGYDDVDDYVFVNKAMPDAEQQSTLLHELQHGVQHNEGFAGGGSPDNAALLGLDEAGQFDMARKAYEEASGKSGQSDAALLAELTGEPIKEYIAPDFDTLPRREQIKYLESGREMAYRRLAGEAEARNVQTRQDWTQEQRRATAPWESLDVPENELIVRAGEGIQRSEGRPIVKTVLPAGKTGADEYKRIKARHSSAKTKRLPSGEVEVSYVSEYQPAQVKEGNDFLYDFDPSELKKTEFLHKDTTRFPEGFVGKPIALTRQGGEYHILDGHHRAKLAQEAGRDVRGLVIPEEDFNIMKDKGIHQGDMLKEWIASGAAERLRR